MREYLRNARRQRGKSQAEAGALLGISQNYYSAIETGERQRDMSYALMGRLAAAFGVSVQEIIRGESAYARRDRPPPREQ